MNSKLNLIIAAFIILIQVMFDAMCIKRLLIFEEHLSVKTMNKVDYKKRSSSNTIHCPESLYDSKKWWLDIFSDSPEGEDNLHRNVLRTKSSVPQVILMHLEREEGSFYLNRTLKSLDQYGYSYCKTHAVDSRIINSEEALGIDFGNVTQANGVIGCFMSHYLTWLLGLKLGVPVISLESDTMALDKWDIDLNIFKEYDILFAHTHDEIKRKCESGEGPLVRSGLDTWYATGAMLFTNNNPEKVRQVFQEEIMMVKNRTTPQLPIGHWINEMWSSEKLKVGSICPPKFQQVQDHGSTV